MSEEMTYYFYARAAFDLLAQSYLITPESYFSLLFSQRIILHSFMVLQIGACGGLVAV